MAIQLPARRRTYRVALTPLADAMFQLLTFFMLTTSLQPYSLITLRTSEDGAAVEEDSTGPGAADAPAPPPRAAPATPGNITIWTLGDGTITTGGQVFERSQIYDLAEALGSQDAGASVLLVLTEAARVQDMASAMEALRGANVDTVQIANEGS